jgi:hypothetical protein
MLTRGFPDQLKNATVASTEAPHIPEPNWPRVPENQGQNRKHRELSSNK